MHKIKSKQPADLEEELSFWIYLLPDKLQPITVDYAVCSHWENWADFLKYVLETYRLLKVFASNQDLDFGSAGVVL